MISDDRPTTTPGRKPVHVAQATGDMEWYTPDSILEIARVTMGGIDLDPASCAAAQERVKAGRYFDCGDDGLKQQWSGRVWLNPPYARGIITRFACKLAEEVRAGHIPAALWLSNNATETAWFSELTSVATAMFFPTGRIRSLSPTLGEQRTPLQGQVLVYIGQHEAMFAWATRAVPGFLCSPIEGASLDIQPVQHLLAALRREQDV